MTQAFNLSQLANNVNSTGLLNAATGLYNQTPVANGGTGLATATGALIGAGTTISAVAASTAGNVLTSDGTTWVSSASVGGAATVTRIYTSPATWTRPSTLKAVKVTMVAGGGGGGNVSGGVTAIGGNGGYGGVIYGYAQAPAVPAPQAITVGTGGTAQTSGGTSSFGAIFSTTGGSGGTQGSGQAAPGGSFAITSTPAPAPTLSSLSLTNSPTVLVSIFGAQGATPSPQSNGTNGTGYGSGGSGGNNGNGPAKTGGSGTAGFVMVEEFY